MTDLIKHFSINREGRDLAVGDIHGHFSKLEDALRRVRFDPRVDRLFGTGDIVDRGPECLHATKWLNLPWFKSVRGNHDDYVARYGLGAKGPWLEKAGVWFNQVPKYLQEIWGVQFSEIPIALDVMTPHGRVGIVHADCVLPSWTEMCWALSSPDVDKKRRDLVMNSCMWSRRRMELNETDAVIGVSAVVVGHTPVKEVTQLGNVYHIDTAGWTEDGHFTLLNLHTMEVEPTVRNWRKACLKVTSKR